LANEKSEKATLKKRSDERKKGNVFVSKDAVALLSLMANFAVLNFYFPSMMSYLRTMIQRMSDDLYLINQLSIMDVHVIMIRMSSTFIMIMAPLLIVSMLVTIVGVMAQTRLLFTGSLLKFKFDRIDPIKGFKRFFSLRSVFELVKSMIKISALITIVVMIISPKIDTLQNLFYLEFSESLLFLSSMITSIIFGIGGFFAFIAVIDYGYQWYEHEKNIRMSKQDIKEEYKQIEGDPQIKGKLKERQRAISMRRMMQQVPLADVIIRNPTHYAIALKYDQKKSGAPIVLAKGMDSLAIKIIEIAQKHEITTIENKPLARGLYEAVDINMQIPEEFYHAVAEVLAVIYRKKEKGSG
jgi:flagellar biosynthesis protein FlhB